MATLVLQVPDESLVSKVKQACKMLMGVTSVKVQKPATKTKEYDILKGIKTSLQEEESGNYE